MEDKTVRVVWPTTREDGSPLPLGRITHAEISFAVRNDPEWFGTPRTVEPVAGQPFTEFVQQAMEPGTYFFRGRCFDDAGRASEETIAQVTVGVESESAPGAIVLEFPVAQE